MMKIVAFYYSQTGQGLDILKSVCRPLLEDGQNIIIYKEVPPLTPFPFPWSSDAFFEAFPESRLGIGTSVRVPELADVADAELVIIAYPVWFLSPSIPTHGFFADGLVRQYLHNRPIVTVCGCRNMWIMSHNKVKEYITACGGRLVGNIVLQDRHHNLVSVITIVRWLIGGRKERSGIFPAAGVSPRDVEGASVFGKIIAQAVEDRDFDRLQDRLAAAKAVRYKPNIAFVEKTGHRIFGVWAKWILKKGTYGDSRRSFRLKMFKYYLYAVIFAVSPVGLMFFYLSWPFRLGAIRREKRKLFSVDS